MRIPYKDSFGVLMRRDSPLSVKEIITPKDLLDKPLILSRQMIHDSSLPALFHCSVDKLNIAATYNLLFNGSLMVDEGMGYAICLDKIINVSGESSLCFRPLAPQMEAGMNLVWKKYQVFTKASEKFLLKCRDMLEQ
ncbi:MAG: LysR family transcriptional regulator substrate-binding protein [Lachnospiraceae bacterium]|nr:LysR family transcriptional regulator substrate-binding protein [Lachnospiraceae bacterium]